ncbi:hypothetical protein CLIM01_15134 [Colletotrichum limetticola]|uniref:Uncharacterized protein n=1 Tax=Colletotrichum limetticola TaxID=1209924 RepID=A0ABQ9P5Y3_9PEZI|nr:hypothetical protein CLIM01_15134 [Colletotrichum limetticola]
MKKFRLKSSSDENLVRKCAKEVGMHQIHKQCYIREWHTITDEEYEPVADTAFLVVDMRTAEDCAVRIYTSDAEYKSMVGIENKGYAVIIPWEPGLNILCNGNCKVAEVIAIEDKST